MKKLMIAAAIVCVATASQAAVVNWTFSEQALNANAYDLSKASMYIVEASAWDTLSKASSLSLADVKAAAWGDAASFTTTAMGPTMTMWQSGKSEVKDDRIVDGTRYDLMYVIVSADEKQYQAMAGTLGADGYIVGGTGNPQAGQLIITPADTPYKSDGMKDFAAVPEPTSGLLLLLGVAGLALKRRRA